jgi:curved DNA-binding protein CbpA
MEDYNFYELFNIQENATNDQIMKAYKILVSIYHSDRTGKSDDSVKLINHAKEVLSNPLKRSAHDSFVNTIKNKKYQSSGNSYETNSNTSLNYKIKHLLSENERLQADYDRVRNLYLKGIDSYALLNDKTKHLLSENGILKNENNRIKLENTFFLNENKMLQTKFDDILKLHSKKERKHAPSGCLLTVGIPNAIIGCLLIIAGLYFGILSLFIGILLIYASFSNQKLKHNQ